MLRTETNRSTIVADLAAGTVVFLVALPLCLGIAQASGAAAISGLIAGIIGGLVVAAISRSHTSVSGPAAGLTAVVAAQLAALESFEAFLLALFVAGLIQIVLGVIRAGAMSAFFPTSVIHGLLAAIGVILILKQIPHVLGHDADPEGDMSYEQPDHENTFSEIFKVFGKLNQLHMGAAMVGIASIALLVIWDKIKVLKKSKVPPAFIVVVFGVVCATIFSNMDENWQIGAAHMVQVPVLDGLGDVGSVLRNPDWSLIFNPAIYMAAITIAIVASLETLLNLEAVDKLDPQQRQSPPNRELIAQGVGNSLAGLVGGIPVTSVIVRSSVNINAGSKTKLSALIHGGLLLVSVLFFANLLNQIPIASLAAILLMTGIKLASPKLFKKMWHEGRYQFIPFVATVSAIVMTDLLIGVLIGLAISVSFLLYANVRNPVRQVLEKHLGGDVLRIQLAEQVSFLNRAGLERALRNASSGTHILIDAQNTTFIDPDVLSLIRDFRDDVAPKQGVSVSLNGFQKSYELLDDIRYVDYSTRELQEQMTPAQVVQVLADGNERFRTGRQLTRDFNRQLTGTSRGQHPLAVVLSCIDSRSPAELLFDLGLGDIFSVRIAGNVISDKVLGSMEYGCNAAGAKLVLVLGHTRCGAVTAAVNFARNNNKGIDNTGCQHLLPILEDIQSHIDSSLLRQNVTTEEQKEALVDRVARDNVIKIVDGILSKSQTLARLVGEGRIAILAAMYDISTGKVEFIESSVSGIPREVMSAAVNLPPLQSV